jgi:hypothetical protein
MPPEDETFLTVEVCVGPKGIRLPGNAEEIAVILPREIGEVIPFSVYLSHFIVSPT